MTRLFEFYNIVYSRTIKPLRDAGSKAFSEANWSTLKATVARIKKPSLASIEQVHEQIAALKKSLFHKADDRLDVAPYPVDWQGLLQPSYQRWQIAQVKLLNDPLWWYQCFEEIEGLPVLQRRAARKRLREVQKAWKLQNAYAHYSTLEVIHIYQTAMPVFSAWLKHAQGELKNIKARLTSDSRSFYENYLEWFERALEEEKILLRSSLHERLTVGLKKGYGAWDKLIESLRDELKNLAVFPPTSGLDRSLADGHLTPEMFVAIRNIIEAEGSEEEKAKLHALAYYRPLFDNQVPFTQHEQHPLHHYRHQYLSRNESMSFKSTLYSYLPRFLQRLFWDEEVRTQFFQHPDYQFLLAQEAAFLNSEIDMSDATRVTLLSHPTWQQSQLCLQLISREIQRIKQWLQYPLAFFFPEMVNQLQNYQQSLKRSSDSWLSKQLKLIQFVMADKTIFDLSIEDQSTLQSTFINVRTLQEQGLCSETIKHQLADLEQHYRALCQETDLPPKQAAALSEKPTLVTASPCDTLREALFDTIASFESTENAPNTTVQTLKNQLHATSSYDKTLLRICVLDYLKHATDLPRSLKRHLQTILDKPEFSQSALNQSVIQFTVCQLPEDLSPITPTAAPQTAPSMRDSKYAPLDEDPWNYSTEQLETHCEALKRDASTSTLSWNQPLCQYVIHLLKHIYALAYWDDFVLHRQKITLLLATLAEISQKTLPALHRELNATAMLVPTLASHGWDIFKKINIEIQIDALESLLKKEVLSQEATSYKSQQEFAFLRPLPVCTEQKTDPTHLPPPISLPTNTL